MKSKVRVGITHGDINSISYEVILKTLLEPKLYDDCIPIIYGSAKVAAYHRKALNINNLNINAIRTSEEANKQKANLINCTDDELRVELGKSTPQAGQAAYQALQRAVEDLKAGKIDVLVTGPINKTNIQGENFKFPGHTEYLAQQFGNPEVLMLMTNETLRVGVVTGHIPLSEVPAQVTEEKILGKIRILSASLTQDFGIRKPRIAVLGLNPHAGDEGLIGTEEQSRIIPALKRAREADLLAYGPYPADGFFGSGSFKKFDAVLAMYHDQGLIPFKALSYEGGVNYTAGLPIIRTSPAHGTAYDLAGKNEASEESFRKALYEACDIFHNRALHRELTSNPLKHYDVSDQDK
jgi:4-hydroxythreonine-4-phosphate dehydrogenase